jgi:hypothetical protein
MPAAPEFRFSIKYTGDKAARLVSGSISHAEMCFIFKKDLTALGANHPKVDTIQKGPLGSVYFIYSHSRKTLVRLISCRRLSLMAQLHGCGILRIQGQHQRYMAVEKAQNIDLHILAAKSKCSM